MTGIGRTLPLSYSEAERLLVAEADARNGNFIKNLIDRLFITSWPRTRGSKPQQRGLTQVLRRPVEIAAQSGQLLKRSPDR